MKVSSTFRYNESIVNLDLLQTSVQTTRITLMSTLVTYKIRSSNFINCFKSNNISERSHPPFQENISGKSGENNKKKKQHFFKKLIILR